MHWYELVLTTCVVVVSARGILFIAEYLAHKKKDSIRLSFNDFQRHYTAYPGKFGFEVFAPYVRFEEYPDIQFTFLDYVKYRIWRHKNKKKYLQERSDKQMKKYLEFVNDQINI